MSTTEDDALTKASEFLAKLLTWFGAQCFRAWLLSVAAGLLFPGIALGFWQWVVVVIAVRFLLVDPSL